MDKKTLLKTVVDALEDVKGQNIRVYDTTKKTSAFDHVVIASGTSNRQTRALASAVSKAVKAAGGKIGGIEGTDTGEWVLVDCGSVICHCMQPAIRQYYDLEELWGPDALDVKALFAKAEQKEQETKPARKRATRSTATKKAQGNKDNYNKKARRKKDGGQKDDARQENGGEKLRQNGNEEVHFRSEKPRNKSKRFVREKDYEMLITAYYRCRLRAT